MVKTILRLEGLLVFVISTYIYFKMQYSAVLFLVLLLAPDISMLGYLKDNKFGASVYNLFHTYFLPIGVYIIGLWLHNETSLMIGLIWLAHIGMDRMVGYGLKYPNNFKDSHFNNV